LEADRLGAGARQWVRWQGAIDPLYVIKALFFDVSFFEI
jgi:hypothetical protein